MFYYYLKIGAFSKVVNQGETSLTYQLIKEAHQFCASHPVV